MTRALAALIALTTLAALTTSAAPAHAGEHMLWRTDDTAYLTPPGRVEVNLFGSTRWSPTDDTELATDLLWNILIPNIQLKHHWATTPDGWTFTTQHRASYPTLLYSTTSREGTGGLLPATLEPPQIIALETDALISRYVARQHLITLRAGVEVAPRFGGQDVPIIELPLLYPRTASSMTWATFRLGLQLDGQIWRAFDYHASALLYVLPAIPGGAALEHRARVAWRPGRHLALEVGYTLSYANYPYGAQVHMFPAFDFAFAFE